MCILYVRRIRNISNDKDEEEKEVEKVGGGLVGGMEKRPWEERQL